MTGLSEWPRFAYFRLAAVPAVIGWRQFAMLEAVLIISVLAEQFQFSSVPGQGEAVPEALVSLRVKNGRRMIPHRR